MHYDCSAGVRGRRIFTLALALRVLTYVNKVRLQQAISEQNVIIVTRLLYCSRRNKWKEKEK